jgi:hypothetical protein
MKYISDLCCVAILIVGAGCSVSPHPTADIASNPESQATISFFSSATKTTIARPPELETRKLCPLNASVSMGQLGLPDNIGLLAVPEGQILGDTNHPLNFSPLLFSANSDAPNVFGNINSKEYPPVVNIRPSPSGSWLAITRWELQSQRETLWISSPEGLQQSEVAQISPRQRVSWISDEDILLVGVPNESYYEGHISEEDLRPLFSINPFSLIRRDMGPLPEGAIYVPGSYHIRDTDAFAIYKGTGSQQGSLFLFDYQSEISTPVFVGADATNPHLGIGIGSDGLYYYVKTTEIGAELGLDLTTEDIMEPGKYTRATKRFSDENVQGLRITSIFPWTNSYIPILASDPDNDQSPTHVYSYDRGANEVRDYCLPLTAASLYVNFAPDGQYVAFTTSNLGASSSFSVTVLDCRTGHYSVINRVRAIGFVMLP